jgi:hypothetical protein
MHPIRARRERRAVETAPKGVPPRSPPSRTGGALRGGDPDRPGRRRCHGAHAPLFARSFVGRWQPPWGASADDSITPRLVNWNPPVPAHALLYRTPFVCCPRTGIAYSIHDSTKRTREAEMGARAFAKSQRRLAGKPAPTITKPGQARLEINNAYQVRSPAKQAFHQLCKSPARDSTALVISYGAVV